MIDFIALTEVIDLWYNTLSKCSCWIFKGLIVENSIRRLIKRSMMSYWRAARRRKSIALWNLTTEHAQNFTSNIGLHAILSRVCHLMDFPDRLTKFPFSTKQKVRNMSFIPESGHVKGSNRPISCKLHNV